jgi:uncharacterized integral membrane protein (TIGR00698 family)
LIELYRGSSFVAQQTQTKKTGIMHKKRIVFILLASLTLFPIISPGIALLAGFLTSLLGFKDEKSSAFTSLLLKASIVLMGFSMNLTQVVEVSSRSFWVTAMSLAFVFISGLLLGRLLKVDKKTSLLITCGTAICGGSAIAAAAPVIHPKHHQLSFALTIVFVLNAAALFLFPLIGHHFHLSQEVFGYWAAIAIHDTSSVVGAGAAYGNEALQVATTVKLVRALWIIPVTLVLAFAYSGKKQAKIKVPWFIGLFLLGIVINYLFPAANSLYSGLKFAGSRGMVLALFLIGSQVSIKDLKKAGWQSFLLGLLLWICISVASFLFLTH